MNNEEYNEIIDLLKARKEKPSLIEVLTEIRDDLKLIRQAMEPKKQYETKEERIVPKVRFKGQFENTGAMEAPETK